MHALLLFAALAVSADDAPTRTPLPAGAAAETPARAPLEPAQAAPSAAVSHQRTRLLIERMELVANMPRPSTNLFLLIGSVVAGIADGILLASDQQNAVLWGTLLAIDGAIVLFDAIFLGINVSRKSGIEDRLAEIDRQLLAD